jgi:hypothetical protein
MRGDVVGCRRGSERTSAAGAVAFWWLLRRAAVAVGLCLIVASCIETPSEPVVVQNNTTERLTFGLVLADGTEDRLGRDAPPGERVALLAPYQLEEDFGLGKDGCTVGDLIAYGEDGREVARHPPPLCALDLEIWVIGTPAASAS